MGAAANIRNGGAVGSTAQSRLWSVSDGLHTREGRMPFQSRITKPIPESAVR